MILLDVNLLIAGHRPEDPWHAQVGDLLDELFASPLAIAVPDPVLTAFVRITTNPRIYSRPTSLDEALGIATAIRRLDNCLQIAPGPRHRKLLAQTCRDGEARGPLVTDAHLTAPAIEHGCDLVSFDRDFARFPGLPLAHAARLASGPREDVPREGRNADRRAAASSEPPMPPALTAPASSLHAAGRSSFPRGRLRATH